MAGLRKVLEKMSSGDRVDKATQTKQSPKQSPLKREKEVVLKKNGNLRTNITTRGHIYEDFRDTRATEDVGTEIARENIKEVCSTVQQLGIKYHDTR